ncbi:cation:proton antiporter domain-containing protein [Streptomyces parvulus]|uniref:cation:proton antiporter domain-containing protein n=1 Tax=Streptomyces parvulus TaxID=146923 RepID=UPI0033B413C9
MEGTWSFGLVILFVALAGLAALGSNRLSERTRIPAPAFFLVVAAVAVDVFPTLRELPTTTVQDVVTVALVVLLFQGGMDIGWRRFRPEARAILSIGVLGTFATAGLLAVGAHLLLGLDWRTALLLGTALAPTDPAVVFSVLGRRKITGRTGVLLPGESGANDPVGIALMAGLLGATSGGALETAGDTALLFVEEMAIGAALGVAGGWGLKHLIRKVPLPAEGLYPLRTLAGAFAVYGLTTVAHGSGFLAVFVAGVLLGDVRAPYKKEIERFHTALGSLGEVVAFTLLGLTVPLWTFTMEGAWTDGIVLAVLLAFVIRPLVLTALLWPMDLSRGEKTFLAFTGLKGAVPVLLGSYLVSPASGAPTGCTTSCSSSWSSPSSYRAPWYPRSPAGAGCPCGPWNWNRGHWGYDCGTARRAWPGTWSRKGHQPRAARSRGWPSARTPGSAWLSGRAASCLSAVRRAYGPAMRYC